DVRASGHSGLESGNDREDGVCSVRAVLEYVIPGNNPHADVGDPAACRQLPIIASRVSGKVGCDQMKSLTPISRNLYVKRSQPLLGRGRPGNRNHTSPMESRSRSWRSESDPGSFQTQAGIRSNGKIGV